MNRIAGAVRAGLAVVQIGTGIATAYATGGLGAAWGVSEAALGYDEYLDALRQFGEDNPNTRSYISKVIDSGTGNTNTTDWILFATDIGTGLASSRNLIIAKTQQTKVAATVATNSVAGNASAELDTLSKKFLKAATGGQDARRVSPSPRDEYLASAPEGSWRPTADFTYQDDLYEKENMWGVFTRIDGIRVQSGLPRLMELGVLRHEYAHSRISQLSGGVSDVAYYFSNFARIGEEFVVHTYATRSALKGLLVARTYINPKHMLQETATYLTAAGLYYAYRSRE